MKELYSIWIREIVFLKKKKSELSQDDMTQPLSLAQKILSFSKELELYLFSISI